MRKYWIVVFVVCLAFLLVACNPEGEAPLPTLIPTLAAPPTQPPTIAPPIIDDTPVPDSSPTQQISNELPPTWTPTFTAMPSPLPASPTAEATFANPELPETCDTFGIDLSRSQRTFPLGASPFVAWIPADNTQYYRVWVTDEFGMELSVEYIAETEFNFPAELFQEGRRYGWNVYPVDEFGDQMCYRRGGELVPFLQR